MKALHALLSGITELLLSERPAEAEATLDRIQAWCIDARKHGPVALHLAALPEPKGHVWTGFAD